HDRPRPSGSARDDRARPPERPGSRSGRRSATPRARRDRRWRPVWNRWSTRSPRRRARAGRPRTRDASTLLRLLRLELGVVSVQEVADLVRHVEELGPLLLVERDRETAQTVQRGPALRAHLERDARLASSLQLLVLGSQPGDLGVQVVVFHGFLLHTGRVVAGRALHHSVAGGTITGRRWFRPCTSRWGLAPTNH